MTTLFPDFDWYDYQLNLTEREMVGLIINVDKDNDPVEMEEFKEIYFKLKIYPCDDLESIRVDDNEDDQI